VVVMASAYVLNLSTRRDATLTCLRRCANDAKSGTAPRRLGAGCYVAQGRPAASRGLDLPPRPTRTLAMPSSDSARGCRPPSSRARGLSGVDVPGGRPPSGRTGGSGLARRSLDARRSTYRDPTAAGLDRPTGYDAQGSVRPRWPAHRVAGDHPGRTRPDRDRGQHRPERDQWCVGSGRRRSSTCRSAVGR
jgi:hypothetical protein